MVAVENLDLVVGAMVMDDKLFSPHWYRVASLTPALIEQCKIVSHQYRRETWYLIQDKHSGRHYRFNANAYYVISQLDSSKTVDQIWHTLSDELGDDAPTQDDIVQLLGTLYQSDLLVMGMTPDVEEILHRQQGKKTQQILGKIKNPLSIRIPLLNPDALLSRWYFVFRFLFTRTAAVFILLIIVLAAVLAIKHWSGLAAHAQELIHNPINFLLLVLCYPFVKALHELGHGFTLKHYGADVNEMGVILMVFFPVPYVDASEASLLKNKWQRILVSAAGIIVELWLSALAMLAWLYLHDGLARDVAFTVMIIGGVSTLLFNGNPLLRFDGYYVFADVIEFPDLSRRANNYYFHLFQHYLFGINHSRSPAKSKREHVWLSVYGLAACVFRVFILLVICFYVASHYFMIGVLLALWVMFSQIVLPVVKGIQFLLQSPHLYRRRQRAIAVTAGIVGSLLFITTLLPLPFYNMAPGVMWLPEQAHIRAEANGFIEQLLVKDGQFVEKGTALMVLSNPSLQHQVRLLEGKQEELRVQYIQARDNDLVEAERLRQEMESLAAEVKDAQQRAQSLTIVSATNGRLVIPNSQNAVGKYVSQGDSLAYLFSQNSTRIRVVVPQALIGLVREKTQGVQVRLSSCMDCIFSATINQEVPLGTNQLPSKALGYSGGGYIPTDSTDPNGLKTVEPHFQFELQLLDNVSLSAKPDIVKQAMGQRAYVRFDHGWEPLAFRWYRRLSQLFLTELNV